MNDKDIELIDAYLFKNLSHKEEEVFRVRLNTDKYFWETYTKHYIAYQQAITEKAAELQTAQTKRKRYYFFGTLALLCLIGIGIGWWVSKNTAAPISNMTPPTQDTTINKAITTQDGVTVGSGDVQEKEKESSKTVLNSDNKNNTIDTGRIIDYGNSKMPPNAPSQEKTMAQRKIAALKIWSSDEFPPSVSTALSIYKNEDVSVVMSYRSPRYKKGTFYDDDYEGWASLFKDRLPDFNAEILKKIILDNNLAVLESQKRTLVKALQSRNWQLPTSADIATIENKKIEKIEIEKQRETLDCRSFETKGTTLDKTCQSLRERLQSLQQEITLFEYFK